MDTRLSTLTKVLLIVWAVVTIPGGLLMIFAGDFANMVVWTAPLPSLPPTHAYLSGAIGFGTGIAAAIALLTNRRAAALPLLGMIVGYVVFAEIVAIRLIVFGAVPLQLWVYVIFGICYLVATVIAIIDR